MHSKRILILLTIGLIAVSSLSAVAAMEIQGGAFSTNGGLEDLTYASIDVGSAYSGDNVVIQIWYSRDGSILNNGNMVPITVTSDGFVNVRSADAYSLFPDNAQINIFDSNNNLLASHEVHISGPSSDSGSSSSSGSGGSSYHSGTSSSYVGNSETGKFHAPGCGDVDKMDPSNKVFFSSRDEAASSGYSPCGHCRP